jgi:hypothetical protein
MKQLLKMKKLHKSWTGLLCCLALAPVFVQAQEAEKPELSVNVRYFNNNNSTQYLQVQTKVKANNKLQPVKDISFQLYLDSVDASNAIASVKTNEKGEAKAAIPVSLKDKWMAATSHKFIAVSQATKEFAETTTELPVAKARISIDTLNAEGARTVTAKVEALQNGEWIPAKDVEMKIGVRRLGGQLKIGEDETYTTDSTGQVSGEYKLDSLPADDAKGSLVLVARVEDNENFGNLSVEKTVPWGVQYKRVSHFGERSLYATRSHTPLWLLFMATGIILAVWGVIIFLVFQIIKIKKLGKSEDSDETPVALKPGTLAV